MRSIEAYATLVFDCDGVLLDSNALKTEAFRTVARRHFGDIAAEALVRFHVAHGGMSRQAKFRHLIENWASLVSPAPTVEVLSQEFGRFVRDALLTVQVADGLHTLRAACRVATWLVVSGGSQDELRTVFAERQLAALFDGGIFGNPEPKGQILKSKVLEGAIRSPALYLGDSRLDHQVSTEAGLDFCFVSDWTEFSGWEDYCRSHSIHHVRSIRELCPTKS